MEPLFGEGTTLWDPGTMAIRVFVLQMKLIDSNKTAQGTAIVSDSAFPVIAGVAWKNPHTTEGRRPRTGQFSVSAGVSCHE